MATKPPVKNSFKVSQDRLLMIIIALFVGYQTFKDETAEKITVSNSAFARLEIKVESLRTSLDRLERLVEAPRSAEERIYIELATLKEQVNRNSLLINNTSKAVTENSNSRNALTARITELESDMRRRHRED